MKNINIALVLFLSLGSNVFTACAQTATPSAEVQIAAAVLAAPEDMRDGAQVLGYNVKGELVTLREGTNGMICLGDDPHKDGFSAASYHKDLEPFMARGRELKAANKTGKEIFDMRENEVKTGTLEMPTHPSTLHILSGSSYDDASGEVIDPYYRYVVYISYATPESTGLPAKPRAAGEPWLMDPGTHRAHIMITPPKK
ncbi:MAG: hypothetical protein ACR2MX_19900 [Cyclobacteriaceae bacterium]